MNQIAAKAIALLITLSPALFAQQKGTLTDPRDKKTYKTIKIGEQVWMAENLSYAAKGSKCYDNKPDNCQKYGRLYNWNTAIKSCPKGWHLPSNSEWNEIGISEADSKKLKSKSGFAALMGGMGNDEGDFGKLGELGYWWSSTAEEDNYLAFRRCIYCALEGSNWNETEKTSLLSVRCVKD
jgi:uncharacterized protein (TIGR02145 family)